MTMTREAREPFVKALRSDKYKRGYAALCEVVDGVERHCALGVLYEAAMEAGVKIEKRMTDNDRLEGLFLYDGEAAFATNKILDWSGLKVYEASHLMRMSDQGTSFNKIADYVEENL